MLKQITTLSELLEVMPKLVRLHASLDGHWEPDLDQSQFAISLLNVFNQTSAFFYEHEGDDFKYVVVLHRITDERWHCWLFYMNKKYRDLTKSVVNEVQQYCRDKGVKELRFSTTRTTRSYERWISKFGAIKHMITYKWETE